ncbi:augmin complex subunit msd1 [Musca vetustissima]|uniref:augmin complex subunit msd1 n=1 Tax=Musca vetustissima TaxID=27455 RepID=UPI002AB64AB6|nr:augmin complex subunit msd1 [Musca vetustissima]
MSTQNCLIDKVLQELRTSRSSMEMQSQQMADVLEKSNNALLQIEASRTIKPMQNYGKSQPYTYNKETINDLTKIVDKFTQLLSISNTGNTTDTGTNFEDYLETASQRAEYLGSNVRKLLAIWDTVQQMRTMLLHQDMEMDNDDDDEEKENNYG